MRRRTPFAVGLVMWLAVGATFAQEPPRTSSPLAPIIDATVATIPVGSASSSLGIQGISLNADRSRIYVAQGSRTTMWNGERCGPAPPPQGGLAGGAIGVFDTNLLTKIGDVRVQAGFPIHIEPDPSTGRLFVATSPDWIYVLEGVRQVGSARLGGVPHDIGIDHTNGRGIVTNTNASTGVQTHVALIDLATLTVIRHIDTRGFGPHKAAADPTRHLVYVSHAEFNRVDVIDTATGDLLRQIPTGLGRGGAQNAIDVPRRRLYVVGAAADGTTSQVVAIDLSTEQPFGDGLRLPFGGHGMRVDPETGLLWVVLEEQGQVSVIDPEMLTERARIAVGHCPYYLDIDPILRRAYVTNQGDDSISVVDMTLVPGTSPGGRLEVLNRAALLAKANNARAIHALAGRVLEIASGVRDDALTARLARAEENYRFGWHPAVADETVAVVIGADLEEVRRVRRELQAAAPELIGGTSELSPVAAALLAMSMGEGRVTSAHDLLTALHIRP